MNEEIKIGDLAHSSKGSFKIGPFGSSLKKEDLQDFGIPVAGIENILPNHFVPHFRRFISDQKFSELADYEIKPNDILVSTMGTIGRAAIAPDGIGTVIIDSHLFRMRLDCSKVFPSYLCYAINGYDGLKRKLKQMARGAIMDGLNTSILKECSIPLFSLAEQKRIAAILDKANRLRRQRRYAQTLSDSFLQSVFIKMFGDPVCNPMSWEKVSLNSIGDLDRGRSKHRPRNAPHLFGGNYPFIQTGDIANSSGYIKHFHQTYSEEGLKQSKLWKKGTLCITIAANIAKTSILTFDACFPDSVVGFTPNQKTNVGFIQHWFSFVQRNLEETAPESAQKNINLEILRDLDVISPPLPLQEKFAALVQKFERIRRQQREATRQAEHLFQTLLHRAFRGEL